MHFSVVSKFSQLLHGTVLLLQKQALPKLNPNVSSSDTKSSSGNQSGSPERVKSVLELLSCRVRRICVYSRREERGKGVWMT